MLVSQDAVRNVVVVTQKTVPRILFPMLEEVQFIMLEEQKGERAICVI